MKTNVRVVKTNAGVVRKQQTSRIATIKKHISLQITPRRRMRIVHWTKRHKDGGVGIS